MNDQPAEELAYSRVVDGAKRVKWTYKKDVYSWKVDDKSNQDKKSGD